MSEVGSTWRVLGRADTHGQALPLERDDPIIAARAVRRALAVAGRRALEVNALALATAASVGGDDLRAFARRALGPHGASVQVRGIASPESGALALAGGACRLATSMWSGDSETASWLAVAVGLDAEGVTVALCLEICPGVAASTDDDRKGR